MRHLATLIVAALLLAGCGPAPLGLADIPAYPAASELQPGENPLADSLAETMRGAVGGARTELRLYQLPAGAGLEQARAHYAAALAEGGWRGAAELETAGESFSTAGWQRGSGSGEQVLMLGYLPELFGEPPVLIVALFGG